MRVLFASFCDGFGIFSALCLWPLEARTVVGLLSTGGNSSEGSVQLAVKALVDGLLKVFDGLFQGF